MCLPGNEGERATTPDEEPAGALAAPHLPGGSLLEVSTNTTVPKRSIGSAVQKREERHCGWTRRSYVAGPGVRAVQHMGARLLGLGSGGTWGLRRGDGRGRAPLMPPSP